jgi:hypothetical protein
VVASRMCLSASSTTAITELNSADTARRYLRLGKHGKQSTARAEAQGRGRRKPPPSSMPENWPRRGRPGSLLRMIITVRNLWITCELLFILRSPNLVFDALDL